MSVYNGRGVRNLFIYITYTHDADDRMSVYAFCPRQFERTRRRIIIMSCLHHSRIVHYMYTCSMGTCMYIHAGMRKQIVYPIEIGHHATFFGRRGCDE